MDMHCNGYRCARCKAPGIVGSVTEHKGPKHRVTTFLCRPCLDKASEQGEDTWEPKAKTVPKVRKIT